MEQTLTMSNREIDRFGVINNVIAGKLTWTELLSRRGGLPAIAGKGANTLSSVSRITATRTSLLLISLTYY